MFPSCASIILSEWREGEKRGEDVERGERRGEQVITYRYIATHHL